jgi:DNA-binding NarL/FixJ family response regulator
MANPVRIVIADDHEVFRHGLRAILESQPGWQVVGEAGDGRKAVELAREGKPDIVVLDISMPELNGLDATREILREAPGCEVLILTLHDSEQLAKEVLAAGARGYVLKSDAATDLVAAVNALGRHVPFFTSKVASMVLAGFLNSASGENRARSPGELTARERQVLQLLAEGKSNKEVANALGISVKTVETHRANIMHKLGLHSMTELVRYAMRNKITGI